MFLFKTKTIRRDHVSQGSRVRPGYVVVYTSPHRRMSNHWMCK